MIISSLPSAPLNADENPLPYMTKYDIYMDLL